MGQIKVLMADDEPEVLEIMAKKVSAEGYEVITAKDGVEAWDKILTDSPDVILLDLNMPNRGGYDVLKELRESPPYLKWQPVIIVSAKSELEDIEKGFQLEADHYITKPCSMSDIVKAIKQMANLIPQRKNPFS